MATEKIDSPEETHASADTALKEISDGMAAKFKEQMAKRADPDHSPAPKPPEKKAESQNAADSVIIPAKPKEEKVEASPLDEFKDPKSVNIAKMRTVLETTHKEREEARKEIERLKSELSTKGDTKATEDRLTAIQKERDELAAAIKLQNPRRDPEYLSIVEGQTKLLEKIARKTEVAGGKSDEIREALKLTGKAKTTAIKEALSDLDTDDKAPIQSLILKLEESVEQGEEFLSKSETHWKERQAAQETQTLAQKEQSQREFLAQFDAVSKELPANYFPLREASPDAKDSEGWNNDIRAAKELARKIASGEVPAKTAMEVILKGARADALLQWGMAQYERANAAEKNAKGYQQTIPAVNGNRVPPTRESKESQEQRLERKFREARDGGRVMAD